jgi:hypothetical protein
VEDEMMKTAPDHDEAMRILSRIIQDYTWAEFKPILYSPETLKRWRTCGAKAAQ